MTRRLRLDAELVRRSLARSRDHAAELIAAGRVTVAGVVATKPATVVTTDAAVVVREDPDAPDYVSRGGHKLAGALASFTPLGLDVQGRHALDAGASTGGFTDVLLRAGVAEVVAVDVGYGQLAWSLQSDERVTVLDRTNLRDLTETSLPFAPDLVVGDVSFISLTKVLPALRNVSHPDADFLLMVKPQFEVGQGTARQGRRRARAGAPGRGGRRRRTCRGRARTRCGERVREPASRPVRQRRVLRLVPARSRPGRPGHGADRRRGGSEVRGLVA